MVKTNYLYYGDNLDILRRYVKDKSVDLIYIDPPFNSNQAFNVLFKEGNGSDSTAQVKAFSDTWKWNPESAALYDEIVTGKDVKLSQAMQGLRMMLGDCNMLAYLVMMAARLVELHRVLKDTGSLYLHCDWHADAYLRVLCDQIFGYGNLVNEIVWDYGKVSNSGTSKFLRSHDVILLYGKGKSHTWNQLYEEVSERKEKLIKAGYNTKNMGGKKYLYYYGDNARGKIDESKYDIIKDVDINVGVKQRDIFRIDLVNTNANEALGYPTQKPEALLERIIKASSNEGDVVLDAFCGCGSTIASAEKLKRSWIGIDVTSIAITLIKSRLAEIDPNSVTKEKLAVIGEPTTLTEATELASKDKYQFQWWALGLVGARPVEQKKGSDQGIDGRIYFTEHEGDKSAKQIIFQVKGGENVKSGDIRDLRGVMEREKAVIGVYITMAEPTKPMVSEAASAGFYKPQNDVFGSKYPAIQILTIDELMGGKKVDMPPRAKKR